MQQTSIDRFDDILGNQSPSIGLLVAVPNGESRQREHTLLKLRQERFEEIHCGIVLKRLLCLKHFSGDVELVQGRFSEESQSWTLGRRPLAIDAPSVEDPNSIRRNRPRLVEVADPKLSTGERGISPSNPGSSQFVTDACVANLRSMNRHRSRTAAD